MRLARRAPGAIYHVYDEDEYLSGADCEAQEPGYSGERSTQRGLRRLAGVLLLTGASGVLIGLIALDGFRASRAGRHMAVRRSPGESIIASAPAVPARARRSQGEARPRQAARVGAGVRSALVAWKGRAGALRVPTPRDTARATSETRLLTPTAVSAGEAMAAPRAEFGFER